MKKPNKLKGIIHTPRISKRIIKQVKSMAKKTHLTIPNKYPRLSTEVSALEASTNSLITSVSDAENAQQDLITRVSAIEMNTVTLVNANNHVTVRVEALEASSQLQHARMIELQSRLTNIEESQTIGHAALQSAVVGFSDLDNDVTNLNTRMDRFEAWARGMRGFQDPQDNQ